MEDFGVFSHLDGEVFRYKKIFIVKFEIKSAKITKHRPAGIKYSFTLHDRKNNRILGIDNAHAPDVKKRHQYSKKIVEYDHIHRYNKIEIYSFDSIPKLISDFFEEAEKIAT